MSYYSHTDKQSGDGLSLTDWNSLSNAVAGNQGLTLAQGSHKIGIGIGIGDIIPQSKLHIMDDVGATDDTSHDIIKLSKTTDSSLGNGASKGSHAAIALSWYENPGNNYPRTRIDFKTTGKTTEDTSTPVTVMSLRDDGNVGIGTSSPSQKLEVHGNLKVGGDVIIDPSNNIYWSWSDRSIGEHSLSDGVSKRIRFKNSMSSINGNPKGGFDFVDYTGNSVLTITDHKIGIGTDTPKSKLDIAGGGTIGAGYSGTHTAPTNGLLVEGKVGIGTSSPAAKFHIMDVDGNSNETTFMVGPSTGSHLRLGYHASYSWIQSHGNKPLRINELDNDTILNLTAGNVGIGTSSPSEKLHVNGTIQATSFKGSGAGLTSLNATNITSGVLSAARVPDLDASKITSGVLSAARIPPGAINASLGGSGYVGIGTNSPQAKLHVTDNVGATDHSSHDIIKLSKPTDNSMVATGAPKGSHAAIALSWYENSGNNYPRTRIDFKTTDRGTDSGTTPKTVMSLRDDGNVGIGTTSPGAKLDVHGDFKMRTSSNEFHMFLGGSDEKLLFKMEKSGHGSNKTMFWDGDNNWDSPSDGKLKTNVKAEKDILKRLLQLDVKNYQWKGEKGKDPKKIGFIAQDVQPLFPELVGSITDPETKETTLTLKYASFGVLAIGALRELKAEVDALGKEIKALAKKVGARSK